MFKRNLCKNALTCITVMYRHVLVLFKGKGGGAKM